MNTSTTNQNETATPKCPSGRKRMPSMLNRFTEQLLQMNDEDKPIHEIVTWLKTQEIETSASNVSRFLISRRKWRAEKEQFDGERHPIDTFEEWMKENPNASAEMVMERFKMLALSLSLKKDAPAETLRLADRLATTTIRFVNVQSRVANDRSREDYRKRKLVMEEAKHAEWVKCEQTRALEFCLNEAKKYPAVADMFRGAFNALEGACRTGHRAEGPSRTGQHAESTTAITE